MYDIINSTKKCIEKILAPIETISQFFRGNSYGRICPSKLQETETLNIQDMIKQLID